MKKLVLALTAIAVLSIAIISSCSKDDTKSTKDILLSGKWYTKSSTLTMTTPMGASTTTLQDCEKDDYLEFSADGTFKDMIGTVSCDSTDLDKTGKWELKDGDKTLAITDNTGETAGMAMNFKIESMSDKAGVLTIDQSTSVDFGGTPITIKISGKIEVYQK
jgi:hypothetical protein